MKTLQVLWKQNRFLNLLYILVCIGFFSLIYVLIINLNHANIESKTARNFEGKNIYQISDNLMGERESDFFLEDRGYNLLFNFSKSLSTYSGLIYYSAKLQPMGVENFQGTQQFVPYYKRGQSNLSNKKYTMVLTIQANQNVFELNNLKVHRGRLFKKKRIYV
ncbi:hypothetical protein GCM10008986_17060 [Salinibacillus aidingensis]|uniref:Uncharacterized protein n=1 Tax=Salinibacillus aidingensis TaxID=237684 RepID=A0ABP3L4X3_9BACI